jgi:hypothetical protein
MQSAFSPARQPRKYYRHDLRTLTYVTLDAANGGIIRNLNRRGAAVQAVAPLRQDQRVRVRFELRVPRLRIETYGHVSWSNSSGQCGIRFEGMPTKTGRQIDEWIFSDLLANLDRPSMSRSIFEALPSTREEDVSAPPHASIPFGTNVSEGGASWVRDTHYEDVPGDTEPEVRKTEQWLYPPISAGALAWLVEGLVVVAALLLFALIFLSIAHELPPWPAALGAGSSAAALVAAAYWVIFVFIGGSTLSARVAKSARAFSETEENAERVDFR